MKIVLILLFLVNCTLKYTKERKDLYILEIEKKGEEFYYVYLLPDPNIKKINSDASWGLMKILYCDIGEFVKSQKKMYGILSPFESPIQEKNGFYLIPSDSLDTTAITQIYLKNHLTKLTYGIQVIDVQNQTCNKF